MKKLPAGLNKRYREIEARAKAASKRGNQPSTQAAKEASRRSWYLKRGLPVPSRGKEG